MLGSDFNIHVDKKGKFLVTTGGVDYFGNYLNLYYESLTKEEVENFILKVKVSKIPHARHGELLINSPEDRLRVCKKLMLSKVPHVKEIMKEYIVWLQEKIDELSDRRRLFEEGTANRYWIDDSIDEFVRIKDNWNRTLKAFSNKNINNKTPKITEADILRAKEYPIKDMIRFDSSGYAQCVFHDEKTGSMKYYPKTNSVHCFGCQSSADAISVAQKIYGEDFISAVKRLSGK